MTDSESPRDPGFPAYLQGFGVGIAFTAMVVLMVGESALTLALIIGAVCVLTSYLLEKRAEGTGEVANRAS